jgi:hypothetical protein
MTHLSRDLESQGQFDFALLNPISSLLLSVSLGFIGVPWQLGLWVAIQATIATARIAQ